MTRVNPWVLIAVAVATAVPVAASGPQEPIATPQASVFAGSDAFRDAYRVMGEPRIVVYATRSYSGQVDEWQVEQRTETRTTSGGDTVSSTESATVSADPRSAPQYTDDELLFERAFITALVDQGVAVIDRNVIMRQEALRHQEVDALRQIVVSESVVETFALNNNVDLIVSIDMLESTTLPCVERRYMATATRVHTGEVWATADSEEVAKQFSKTTVVGTSEGYQRRPVVEPYSCADLARELANTLMVELSRRVR